MPKLSRMVLGAVVVASVTPALALSPATAATRAVPAPVSSVIVSSTVVASTVVQPKPTLARGWCRIFPKMCAK